MSIRGARLDAPRKRTGAELTPDRASSSLFVNVTPERAGWTLTTVAERATAALSRTEGTASADDRLLHERYAFR